jgi:benzodiazapine receptor
VGPLVQRVRVRDSGVRRGGLGPDESAERLVHGPPQALVPAAGRAFPIVWSTLYGTTALGAAGVVTKLRDQGRDSEADAFTLAHRVNLALNAGWSGAFFRSHRLGFATVWAAVLAASSADLARRAKEVSSTDAAPFVAYAAWCSFATILSVRSSVAALNRRPVQR